MVSRAACTRGTRLLCGWASCSAVALVVVGVKVGLCRGTHRALVTPWYGGGVAYFGPAACRFVQVGGSESEPGVLTPPVDLQFWFFFFPVWVRLYGCVCTVLYSPFCFVYDVSFFSLLICCTKRTSDFRSPSVVPFHAGLLIWTTTPRFFGHSAVAGHLLSPPSRHQASLCPNALQNQRTPPSCSAQYRPLVSTFRSL